MATEFQDISVTGFDTTEYDQDPVHKGMFSFRFYFSQRAPDLWVKILDMQFCSQRTARANSDYLTVRCSAVNAQEMKEKLNSQVLPTVNQWYRREAEAERLRKVARDREQKKILDTVHAA